MTHMENIPWVEKYRPSDFNQIVLDSTNKKILKNIITTNYFPNLLFYGPPGTGKTTTIVNLIKLYQETYSQKHKRYVIHLNASDDRGIDIIRNQINQFVSTKTLFGNGVKFVILDEVDYMTKNAQQALRHLIQLYSNNVRFCLICNYISRIDTALQNEFIRLRFCQLPKDKIYNFLNEIQQKEKLNISSKTIHAIQHMFKSDIRSMINFLQSKHTPHNQLLETDIITDEFWEELIELISTKDKKCKRENKNKNTDNSTKFNTKLSTPIATSIATTLQNECKIKNKHLAQCIYFIEQKSAFYNIEIKTLLKDFCLYLMTNKSYALRNEWIKLFKYITHNSNINERYLLVYFLAQLSELYKLS